ncbi:MAG: hypothetical protein ACK58N_12320 [Synechocystis sp.]
MSVGYFLFLVVKGAGLFRLLLVTKLVTQKLSNAWQFGDPE